MDANDLGVLSVCLSKCIVVAPEKPQKELEGKINHKVVFNKLVFSLQSSLVQTTLSCIGRPV